MQAAKSLGDQLIGMTGLVDSRTAEPPPLRFGDVYEAMFAIVMDERAAQIMGCPHRPEMKSTENERENAMAALQIFVNEELAARLASAAAKQGEDVNQFAIEALEQAAARSESARQPTLVEMVETVLGPIWEDQKAHPEKYSGDLEPSSYGDRSEAMLAQIMEEKFPHRKQKKE